MAGAPDTAPDAVPDHADRDADPRAVRGAIARARENVRGLAAIGSPQALLERGPEQLGAGTGFARVMISRLREGTLTPVSLWPGAPVPELTVPLAYPLIEAELVQHPRTVVVDVAAAGRRSPPQLREALGWSAYAAATVTLAGTPIGLLHAEIGAGRRPGEIDRGITELLAAGFSAAFEVAALRQALAAHRDVQRAAIRQLAAGLESQEEVGAGGEDRDEGVGAALVRDPLTGREQEVLDLLARGHTNRVIAGELVISEATVKYHVRNVLRKLGATSRADAVSRHLRRRGAAHA